MATPKRKGANAQKKAAIKKSAIAQVKVGRWLFLALLLFFGVGFLIRWYPTSSFSQKVTHHTVIKGVEVRGTKYLDSSKVVEALGVDSTETLFSFNKDSLETVIAAMEGVKKVRIKRTFAKTLLVTVEEREHDKLCVVQGALYFSDTSGVLWPFIAGGYFPDPLIMGVRDTVDSLGVHRIIESDNNRLNKVVTAFSKVKSEGKRVVSYDVSSLDVVVLQWDGLIPEIRISTADLHLAVANIETLLGLLERQELEATTYIDFSYKNIAFIR